MWGWEEKVRAEKTIARVRKSKVFAIFHVYMSIKVFLLKQNIFLSDL